MGHRRLDGSHNDPFGVTVASRSRITKAHCQQCGSTDPENVETWNDPEFQGYSACCNEIVVISCDEGVCYHGEVAR